jgi:hypothetical protein
MRRAGLGLIYWVASIHPVAWAEIPRWLPAFVIAIGITLAPTASRAQQPCIPLDVVRQHLDSTGVSYDVLNITRTEAASLLADEVTGTEPPSKWSLAVIGLEPVDAEGKQQLFMLFGRDGMICQRLNIPADGVQLILRRVYGWRV